MRCTFRGSRSQAGAPFFWILSFAPSKSLWSGFSFGRFVRLRVSQLERSVVVRAQA